MKRIYSIALTLCITAGSMHGQGEMDAYKLSRNDLNGTARAVSMGGAFGALGGDLTGISINPAGIGVYTKSEVVATLDFNNTSTKTDFLGFPGKGKKFNANIGNFGLVGVFQLYNDEVPTINFGFTYNRLKNFNRKFNSHGTNLEWTLVDYMASRADGKSASDIMLGSDNYPFDDNDWMSVFGYSSNLIQETSLGSKSYQRNRALDSYNNTNSDLYVVEKGSISTYDFNVGTTISEVVSLGLTIAVTDIDYRMTSNYNEDFKPGGNSGYDLINRLKTEGIGWQLRTGIIYKPIDELRLGVSYHSPTWYNMSDFFNANTVYVMDGVLTPNDGNFVNGVDRAPINDEFGTETHKYNYEFRTPDKWTFSAAGVIGQKAILSLDYELTDYSEMKLSEDDGQAITYQNQAIKRNFKKSSTVRMGAEYRVTPQFSIRAGYAWMQSPMGTNVKEGKTEVMTVGSIPQYTVDGDRHNYTYGLGYKFTPNIYLDLGFIMSSQKDDLYSYSKVFDNDGEIIVGSDKASLKTSRFQGLMTLGFRF